MSERQPLPWVIQTGADFVYITSSNGGMVTPHVNRANAEHIVRCVNSHDDLLAACKTMLDQFDTNPLLDFDEVEASHVPLARAYGAIRDAIAKAEGTA